MAMELGRQIGAPDVFEKAALIGARPRFNFPTAADQLFPAKNLRLRRRPAALPPRA